MVLLQKNLKKNLYSMFKKGETFKPDDEQDDQPELQEERFKS